MIARVLIAALGLYASSGWASDPAPVEARNQATPIEAKVGVDPKLGAQLPLETPFVDEQGVKRTLGHYFGQGPVVLAMVYYECPSICGMLITGLFRALAEMKFKPGKEFSLVLVSIDPKETFELASQKKANVLKQYRLSESNRGVHFLTGSEESIRTLASTVGFRYAYDATTKQYAHPAAAVIATADGKISQYHAGVEFSPRDMRLSLVTASGNQIGSALDHFFLYCYRYDPASGRYGLVILNVLRLLGVLTVAGIAVSVAALMLQEKRRARTAQGVNA